MTCRVGDLGFAVFQGVKRLLSSQITIKNNLYLTYWQVARPIKLTYPKSKLYYKWKRMKIAFFIISKD